MRRRRCDARTRGSSMPCASRHRITLPVVQSWLITKKDERKGGEGRIMVVDDSDGAISTGVHAAPDKKKKEAPLRNFLVERFQL